MSLEDKMKDASPELKNKRGVTRRNLLQGASLGVAASLVSPVLSGWSQADKSAAAAKSGAKLTPAQLPPAWTADEIHRRWQGVRDQMKAANYDALIVTQHHSGEMITERQDGDADVEYLTGITLPFKWVIFPLDGKVTVLSTNQIRREPEEKLSQDRGIEIKISDVWSKGIIDSLKEKGLSGGRIGVTNLVDSSRQTEGEVAYTTYDRVMKAFPQAKFVPDADILGRVQIIHSAEEIAAFEKSVAVGELGLRAMFAMARPGVINRVVWLAMFNAMVNASGERPWRLSINTGGGGNTGLNRPLEKVLNAGDILTQECTGTVLGYGTQVNHSILIGSPAPAGWADAAQASVDTFHEMVALIAPGKTVADICAPYDKRLVARGDKPGQLVIHSGGLGTLPRGGSSGDVGKMVLQAGMVFDVKPNFNLKDGSSVQFGDSIVITESGARRLGTRKMVVDPALT
jgi:Xaa-Pro aminopeptidase